MLLYLPDWLVAILILILVLYVYITWNNDVFIKHKLAFVKPLPFFGNMGPMLFRQSSMADHFKHYYDLFPHDKIVGLFAMTKPVFFLKDPDIIKTIMVKDFEYFTDHQFPITEGGDPLFGKSLLVLKGDRWRDMRHTLSPAFTSSKMKAMFVLIEKCGQQMGEHMEKKCKAAEDGLLTLEMKDFYTKFANDVIATTAFGIQCDSFEHPDNEFYRMGQDATNLQGIKTIIFILYNMCPGIMTALKIPLISKPVATFFRTLIHGTIATREKEGIIRPDLIHLLMQARKGTLKAEAGDEVEIELTKNKKHELSDDDVTAQAFLFFFAGFESTSNLLCFMSHLLAMHPDIQTRVQGEIDALLEEENGKVTYEGIQRLKYLDMVISETLRLWPPNLATDRKCVRPYTLQATATSPSIQINVGDELFVPTFALHRDPKFFPDPERFDPERFSDENKHNINPFVYVPFGVGPRVCLGIRFTQMEAKIAIVHLLSRFTLQAVEKTQNPLCLEKGSMTMKIKGGFWLGMRLRSH